ncbi:hypothetical protein EMCRGX_G005336 [Ephydatia muelleri]
MPNFEHPDPPPFCSWQVTEDGDVMARELTQQEVKDVLKKMPHQSAPGPDYVTYAYWKEVDPTAAIITKILETCRRNPSQKGFLPCEGCLEHNFLLSSVLQDSRRRRAPMCITWLDISNAFLSVPHGVLMEMLSRTGVGPHTSVIIKDIYTGSTMCVRTGNDLTAPIPCNKGVKQGCPLSPVLFNFVMEPLIRAADSIPSGGYTIGNHTIRSLTYADDLCVVTQSTKTMQEVLQAIQAASDWEGLKFNTRKCGTLTLSRSARQFAENFTPTLGGESLPALKWEDHYKYLGCKAGSDYKAEARKQGQDYDTCCKAIMEFGLTDWQKLDAVHRFAKPGLTYILQKSLPNKSWAQQLDKEVRNVVKRAFKLPKRTISAFFHAPSNSGGLGIPCIENEIDVNMATTAFKLLTTPDTILQLGRNVSRALRAKLLQRHMHSFKQANDQGRTSHCVSLHPSSNYWIHSGKYISFGEYRFAMKARLNLLPTKTVLKQSGKPNINTSCPGCNGEQETIAHVLNHCPRGEGLIRHRHNAILHWLAKAIPPSRGTQYLEQMIPGDPQGLKPDVVVLNETTKEAWVIDVTVPFESESTLEGAREGKITKYAHLREVLAAKGYQRIIIDAFVIGSLGSWDPKNNKLTGSLGISHR